MRIRNAEPAEKRSGSGVFLDELDRPICHPCRRMLGGRDSRLPAVERRIGIVNGVGLREQRALPGMHFVESQLMTAIQ